MDTSARFFFWNNPQDLPWGIQDKLFQSLGLRTKAKSKLGKANCQTHVYKCKPATVHVVVTSHCVLYEIHLTNGKNIFTFVSL